MSDCQGLVRYLDKFMAAREIMARENRGTDITWTVVPCSACGNWHVIDVRDMAS